uniref:Immunoglobulin domain-containing protein n=1 Tax=Cyprinus carpio TaxID=7962 RepID=A0A8C1SA25_CYPCA
MNLSLWGFFFSFLFLVGLLIWCQAAETLIDQLINLGQNVMINCDFENEVYWFLLKLPYSSVILRSFSSPTPYHYNKHYRQKYSVTSKHLFINNVTTDELGVYFCISTDSTNPQFSNGTRLYIIEPTPPTECQNYTPALKYTEQNQMSWQTLTLISGLINAVLVIVVIGQLKVCVCRNKRPAELSQQLHNTDLQPTQFIQQHLDPNQSQHAEEDSSRLYTNIHPAPVNSTYVALQLPKP